jgi:hypothetical protein
MPTALEKYPQIGPSQAKNAGISEKTEVQIQEVKLCPCCGRAMILTPRIVCEKCNKPLSVKCMTYRSGRVWYAECLTLDLVSKGDTEVDAIRRLQIAMFSYVAVVFTENESTEGLVPRPAPMFSWIRYYCQEILGRLAAVVSRRNPRIDRSTPIQGTAVELKISHC